jgi:glutamate-1-semialdehyde 2,1-aminomutase
VWDLDGHEFIDLDAFGVGLPILGFAHSEVDDSVRRAVASGSGATLNAPEEVALAEMLVELHPWADMASITSSGNAARTLAIRAARSASSRRDVIWHSSDLTADSASLDLELARIEAGVVVIDVIDDSEASISSLRSVQEITRRHEAVMVLDERRSGFRRTLGGVHLLHGIEPDLVVFGSVLGNGYPVGAIVGRSTVLDATPHSPTLTERLGVAAALASIAIMRRDDVPARVNSIGVEVRRRWVELARAVGLTIETFGLPAMGRFELTGLDPGQVFTRVSNDLLPGGYLAGTSLSLSICHDEAVLDPYFEHLGRVFGSLAAAPESDRGSS